MKDQIINYILNNKIINEYFEKVPEEYKDDFRQEILLIILNDLNTDKLTHLENLYKENNLGRYVNGIITNQLKSETSQFHYKYRKNKMLELPSTYEEPITQYQEINTDIMMQKLMFCLNNLPYYNAVLFKLYYGICPITGELTGKTTYRKIAEEIGIKEQLVKRIVTATKKILIQKCGISL